MSNPHLLTGLGASLAMFLSAAGASVASVPSGMMAQHAVGWSAWAPIIISGVLAIYGCIIGVIVSKNLMNDDMSEAEGYRNFTAGLAVGLSCLVSGLGMAKYVGMYLKHSGGQQGSRSSSNTTTNNSTEGDLSEGLISASYKPMVIGWRFLFVLVFLEAIGLYGLIVALFMSGNQPKQQ